VTESYGATGARVGKVVGGKYRVIRRLGEGGMGEVYEAQHTVIGRRFAIKFLHAYLAQNPETMIRFRHEAETAGGIEHENIGAALDFGTADDNTLYLVMEYLEGEDLSRLLVRHGPLPVARATYIIIQACRGLTEAHARGIVHRDLKPENIFICRRTDGSDLVKVVDFGIAKLRTKVTVTKSGVTMGTPCYMSLEQAKGAKEVDHRTDIYSLGVILYEILANARPFPGENYNEVLYNLFTSEPVPLDSLRPGLPAGLSEVIHRAMAREARDRFDSAAALAEALVPYAGRPVTPLQSQIDIDVATVESGPVRAAVESPVSLTSMETTPMPIPVTTTPPRRETMDTNAIVRGVVPGRARRIGITLVALMIVTVPLAYGVQWYLGQVQRPPAATVTGPLPRDQPVALPPPVAVGARAIPVAAPAIDQAARPEPAAPASKPAPAPVVVKVPPAAERATEPARTHKERAERRSRKSADSFEAQPISPPSVRAPPSPRSESIKPPPAVVSPGTPKKRIRHFDPDNPYGP
jgi:serine/threonine protein kinase